MNRRRVQRTVMQVRMSMIWLGSPWGQRPPLRGGTPRGQRQGRVRAMAARRGQGALGAMLQGRRQSVAREQAVAGSRGPVMRLPSHAPAVQGVTSARASGSGGPGPAGCARASGGLEGELLESVGLLRGQEGAVSAGAG